MGFFSRKPSQTDLLVPHRALIEAMRAQGASIQAIADALAKVGVTVQRNVVDRFCQQNRIPLGSSPAEASPSNPTAPGTSGSPTAPSATPLPLTTDDKTLAELMNGLALLAKRINDAGEANNPDGIAQALREGEAWLEEIRPRIPEYHHAAIRGAFSDVHTTLMVRYARI